MPQRHLGLVWWRRTLNHGMRVWFASVHSTESVERRSSDVTGGEEERRKGPEMRRRYKLLQHLRSSYSIRRLWWRGGGKFIVKSSRVSLQGTDTTTCRTNDSSSSDAYPVAAAAREIRELFRIAAWRKRERSWRNLELSAPSWLQGA